VSDARPINVRIFACPDVPGEWCAVCPEYDVVAQDASRPKALAMLADFVAMVETGDAMNGRDPFARASLSDDTVSVYAAMLRDVTAALRRATGKAASPEACAMLREALDDLDDAIENHELAHTVGPLLDEAKTALASDEPTDEESQEWAEMVASHEVSDLVGWSYDLPSYGTLGERVRDFAPTIESAIVHIAPHFIPQMQLDETRDGGVNRVDVEWSGQMHRLVIALYDDRERDSWRLETSITNTVVEEGPLATLNLPLALLAVVYGAAAPCSLEGRSREVMFRYESGWRSPDGCTVLHSGYHSRAFVTPSAFRALADDLLVKEIEDVTDVAVEEPVDIAEHASRSLQRISPLKTFAQKVGNEELRKQFTSLATAICHASVGFASELPWATTRQDDDGSVSIKFSDRQWSSQNAKTLTITLGVNFSRWRFVAAGDVLDEGPLSTLDLPIALLALVYAPPLRWSPFLLRVAPEWVPPDGCRVTSRLGDIVSCTLTPAALAACEADPAVLLAEESTDKCHNGTEDD
jgi:hypothetical protein